MSDDGMTLTPEVDDEEREEVDPTIVEEIEQEKNSRGDLIGSHHPNIDTDIDDRPTKAASIASDEQFFKENEQQQTGNDGGTNEQQLTPVNSDDVGTTSIEMEMESSPKSPSYDRTNKSDRIVKTDLSDWKRSVRREGHHFVILLMVGIFGIALPDFIFDSQTALPNKSRIPGEFIVTNTTALIDGEARSLSYKYFLPDPSFNQKYVRDDKVSCNADCLSVWSGPMPFLYTFITYLVMHYVTKTPYPRYISDLISFTYAYLIGMTLVFWVSKYIKFYVAYPRPDFFHRCHDLSVDLDTEQVRCHFDDKSEYRKGWESFPSGHAAYMFTHSTVSILWMFGKLHYVAKKKTSLRQFTIQWEYPKGTHRKLRLIWLVKVVLSWQWFFALWVAITRIRDNRHFPADTVGGIILGGLCGFTGFKSQFGMNYAHSWRLLEETAHSTFDERFGKNAMKSNKGAQVQKNVRRNSAMAAARPSHSASSMMVNNRREPDKRRTIDIMKTDVQLA